MSDPQTLAAHQIGVLSELADLGMQLARKIVANPADYDDPALAFDRVSRALRLTILLQQKLAKDPSSAIEEKAARVHRILKRIAARDNRPGERTERQISERLDKDFCGDLLNQPIADIIAIICKDLGLNPDWPRLRLEAWAQAELKAAPPNPLPLGEADREAVEGTFNITPGGSGSSPPH